MNITYVSVNASAPWRQDSAINSKDKQITQYYGSTMSKTTGEGNYMSFTFNGTAIYIYGSKRANHGAYSVSIDGNEPVVQLGEAAEPGQFQQLLFGSSALDAGTEHEVKVTNLPSQTPELSQYLTNLIERANLTLLDENGNAWLDIDYVVLTVALPEPNATVYTTRIDDTSSAFQYEAESWTTDTLMNAPEYYNSTAHITHTVNDSVLCSVNGTSVEVLGGLMSDHSNYSVSIDDGPKYILNGSYHTIMPQSTLFTAGQLAEGLHTVRLTNLHPDMFLDIDCLVVNSTIAPPSSGNDTIAPPVIPTNDGHDEGTTPLTLKGSIGITVGIVLGTALILLLAHLGWRWRHKVQKRDRPDGIERVKRIDLTGEEVRPFTSVSPITMYNDAKYLYSPANPTPLWTGAAFPTPLRSAAAFFPYAPPSTAESASFASTLASSSLGRIQGLERGGSAPDTTSESRSDPSGIVPSSSETGTFGRIPILPCPPPPAAASSRVMGDGNRSNGSESGSQSTMSLLRLYNNARSSSGNASSAHGHGGHF